MLPGELFLAFVRYLEKKNIPYAVLGDTANYPHEIHSDVDMVLLPEDFKNCVDIIREFTEHTDSVLVQLLQHEFCASCFVLAWKGRDKRLSFIALDICSDYYENGKPLLRAVDLLKNTNTGADKGHQSLFKTLPPEMEFIYYFIKKTDKGGINEAQFKHLQKQFVKCPELCIKNLENFWPPDTASAISLWIKDNKFSALQDAMPELKKYLIENTRPSVRDFFREAGRKIKRVFQPTGIIIALLGPDGCGKSTLGAMLQKELAPAFRGHINFHLRPYFFSFKKVGTTAPVYDPHAQKPRSAITSALKLIYFLLDYILGFIFILYPLKARSHLILFDRYYHDLMIDPKRYRYKAPLWLAVLIGYLIPKPDLFLVLDAPARIIQSRKQEVPFSETERQRDAYSNFAHWGAQRIVVNTDQPMEETINDINDAVLKFMTRRINNRMDSN
jgi:thymidylate kinase